MIPVLLTAALLLLPGGLAPTAAPLPDGCVPQDPAVSCVWRFDTRDEPDRLVYEFELPVLPRTYASLTIVLDGVDGGWTYEILRETGEGTEGLEEKSHTPDGSTSSVHRAVDIFVFVADPGHTHRLVFTPRLEGVQAAGMTINDADALSSGASAGEFTLTYSAEPLAEGVAPPRPAATVDDPHLQGAAGDARRGAYDLRAVWFDDDRLGDGLVDLRVHVADLDDWDHAQGSVYMGYTVDFEVLGRLYRAVWRLEALEGTSAVEDVGTGCGVWELDSVGIRRSMTPFCEYDWANSTVVARIPERFLGSPGDGELFTGMSATSYSNRYHPGGSYSTTTDGVEDEVASERYAFALGGPAVWDELNPRLAVPPEPAKPWYAAPLASENVPDTLSVLGTMLAAATFLFGFVVVRRHRRQTRELIARVDALVQTHELSVRAGLVALGDLESEFSVLLREGRITEAQYQVAAQRVTLAATRLSLRRDLGDASAGDDVRVEVKGPEARARP